MILRTRQIYFDDYRNSSYIVHNKNIQQFWRATTFEYTSQTTFEETNIDMVHNFPKHTGPSAQKVILYNIYTPDHSTLSQTKFF